MADMNAARGAPRRRRRYSADYKLRAVELTLRGDRPTSEIARDLGIEPGVLSRWRSELAQEAAKPTRTKEELEGEVQELRTRLAEMEEREQILKKSLGILSPPVRGMPKSSP